ncbi:uracil phosphoribosyltransferase [Engelhardtia mirabilis]|uniref:Uracil phosphoribosyltransferase n=1 Tax=Engelhardtia mirabilis TaxID=2528011 RepID=A0A518BQT3_9BACT|nr:Uracil phosphoribosyltransferase [Planctomycetes bacterium Pla133]QDV03669.1 Uracil phosphoribosyltransferase [Planctomycetes bacterium Pla86]
MPNSELIRRAGEREHYYGERVHLVDNALIQSAIARLGNGDSRRAELYRLLELVYHSLAVEALGNELPRARVEVSTRMQEFHPAEGVFRGEALDPSHSVVVVDVIRGGIVPAQIVFEMLTAVLPDACTRLDHLNMARISDDQGRVTGVDLSGSKVGGTVEGATLVIPDPMGATGSTVVRALEHYLEHHGRPAKVVVLPMIATPEFVRRVTEASELVHVFAARLDRGLSAPDVLATTPGERWSEERGLNDHGYIVPGAGGVGEILNNAWC